MTAWTHDGDHQVLRIGGHEARVMRAFGRPELWIAIDNITCGSCGDMRPVAAHRARALAEIALRGLAERKGMEA